MNELLVALNNTISHIWLFTFCIQAALPGVALALIIFLKIIMARYIFARNNTPEISTVALYREGRGHAGTKQITRARLLFSWKVE